VLRDDAVTLIAEGLGFRTDLSAKIIRTMQQAQRELEGGQTLPWFIVNEDDSVQLIRDQAEYALTDAFIREADDLGFYSTARSRQGDEFHVRKMQYDKAIAAYGFTATGYPEVYALRAGTIRVFPIPDDDYLYRWHFYQRQTVLDSNIENAWLKNVPDLLVGMAGEAMAAKLRDKDSLAYFTPLRVRWEVWLKKEIELRLMANELVVMGSDS
jgi:hypothetical protein